LIGGDYSSTGVLWFLARAGGKGREGKGKGQKQQHGSYFWGSRLLWPGKIDMELFTRGAGVIFE
jgi:hypothetical protein